MGWQKTLIMHHYKKFLENFDKKLEHYFNQQKKYIFCRESCSHCCEKGDYPLSEIELKYVMQGFISLENNIKIQIQNNFKNLQKGEACPFLINKKCSIYPFRPIICRVHGLAYICKENIVKLPHCVNNSLNFSKNYANGEINIEPIKENLDTQEVLKNIHYGEIRNLYDWLH